jgi:ATP-dependent DNA helicase DinG
VVSVSAHECLGSRGARLRGIVIARRLASVLTTSTWLSVITPLSPSILRESKHPAGHDLLIVDEGHELADRVTSVISNELTVGAVEIAARRARKVGGGSTGRLDDAAAMLEAAFAEVEPGRIVEELPEFLGVALSAVRDASRELASALKPEPGGGPPDGSRQVARAAVTELFEVADRLMSGSGGPEGPDVVWMSRYTRSDGQIRTSLNVAPLSVAGVLRGRLYTERTVVITSATLTVGGRFDSLAESVGLLPGSDSDSDSDGNGSGNGDDEDGDGLKRPVPRWSSIDVGSPFDYPRLGILYLARALPPPGRDGVGPAVFDELAALIEAAGGRTLGLFSSRRAAENATERLRERLGLPILCQGDDATPTLVREFAREARTCLFGTLSLWQGVDVLARPASWSS